MRAELVEKREQIGALPLVKDGEGVVLEALLTINDLLGLERAGGREAHDELALVVLGALALDEPLALELAPDF